MTWWCFGYRTRESEEARETKMEMAVMNGHIRGEVKKEMEDGFGGCCCREEKKKREGGGWDLRWGKKKSRGKKKTMVRWVLGGCWLMLQSERAVRGGG